MIKSNTINAMCQHTVTVVHSYHLELLLHMSTVLITINHCSLSLSGWRLGMFSLCGGLEIRPPLIQKHLLVECLEDHLIASLLFSIVNLV